MIAAHASVVLAYARAEQNLWQAIDSRNLIGQAQGILMERFGLTPERHSRCCAGTRNITTGSWPYSPRNWSAPAEFTGARQLVAPVIGTVVAPTNVEMPGPADQIGAKHSRRVASARTGAGGRRCGGHE